MTTVLNVELKLTKEEKEKIVNECLDILNERHIEEFEKIKAEIKEWYWQSDKQELAKDPCVVDAMTDLFIRTIDKHIYELKGGKQ